MPSRPAARSVQVMSTATRDHPSGSMRVSDADRDRAIAELSEHYQAGRLTTEELEDRTGRALQARTTADLAALFTDLPRRQAPVTGAASAPSAAPGAAPRAAGTAPASPARGGGLSPSSSSGSGPAAAAAAAGTAGHLGNLRVSGPARTSASARRAGRRRRCPRRAGRRPGAAR